MFLGHGQFKRNCIISLITRFLLLPLLIFSLALIIYLFKNAFIYFIYDLSFFLTCKYFYRFYRTLFWFGRFLFLCFYFLHLLLTSTLNASLLYFVYFIYCLSGLIKPNELILIPRICVSLTSFNGLIKMFLAWFGIFFSYCTVRNIFMKFAV